MILRLLVPLALAISLHSGFAAADDKAEERSFGQRVDRAIERFQSYSAEKKEEAREAGKELLAVLDERIEKTRKDASEAAADAREASKEELEQLQELRDDVAARLDRAGETTASNWARFKSAVGDAVTAFRNRMKED